MQDNHAPLEIVSPEAHAPEKFSDAEAAVDRLCALYDQAVSFLHDRFLDAMATGHPGVRIRAFYPEIRITTTTHAKVDSRLSFGHVPAPGTFAASITRPDLFRHYLKQQIGLLLTT